jgi:hypothetical protein
MLTLHEVARLSAWCSDRGVLFGAAALHRPIPPPDAERHSFVTRLNEVD